MNCIGPIFMMVFANLPIAGGTSPAPPDLRLEWREAGPLQGTAGETVDVRFRLRNVGGSPAFAVIQKAHTSLGPYGPAVRLQPGPKAGETLERGLSLAFATGMKELCIQVALQTVDVDDPRDPNASDNRICRVVHVAARRAE